jgi:hypothetical protein
VSGPLPGATVEEVSVEAILQPEQHLSRLAALPVPNDVPEVIESLDARSSDDQRLGRRAPMRGERVRKPSRTSVLTTPASPGTARWK